MTFHQEYTTQTTILQSSLTRENIPLLFVQGVFAADASLSAEASDAGPKPEGGGKLLETWAFRSTEPENQTQIRLQIPAGADEGVYRSICDYYAYPGKLEPWQ